MALISEDTVGYLSNSKVFRDNIGDIESKSWAIGFQTGFGLQRKIFKFKKTNFFMSGGFLFSGYLISDIKDETFLFKEPMGPFSDSIVIYHDSHKQYYFNPFIQFKFKSQVKKKAIIYGARVLVSKDLSSQLKIRYRVGNSAYQNSTYYRGTFKDYRNQ